EVEYTISEGPRYVVQNVLIEGNRVLTEEKLRSEFKLNAGDHFNARHLNQDLLRIRNKYGQQGRLFAKVEAVPRFLETPAMVDVVYRIDEDRIRRIRRLNVHFEGDHPHTKETVVHNRSLIRPGDLANSRLIERTKRRLEGTQLFERGPQQGVRININPIDIPAANVSSRQSNNGNIVRGQDAPTGGLFQTSPPAPSAAQRAMQPITHRTSRPATHPPAASPMGTTRPLTRPTQQSANPGTIYRGQSDGDVFAPNNPLSGNSPQGDPLTNRFREPPPGWVDLDIYLNETRTGRLMFGVGVNSDAGMVGSIVLDESNFDIMRPPQSWSDVLHGHAWRGGGQRFRLEAIPGNVVSRYLVSWTDPYFLDTDYSLSTAGFYFNRFYPDWDEDRTGGTISLGKQINNEVSINGKLRLENVDLSNPDIPTPSIVQESLGASTLSTFKVSAAHDSRDSSFLPSEGHLAQVSYEQAFGDFSYPRVDGELRQYFTVFTRPDGGGRHVVSVGAEMGWTGDETPVYERFFAGGFQTFRGFSYRGVSPREFDTSIGGQWLFVGSAEYKLPVTADDMISLVFFSDFGTVEEEVTFDEFRVTVGAGLRLTIPAMGPVPLAFDFAFPLAKQEFDDTRVFSFYVGINR
ncbi:MAG: BamA/TamA family outer membrane protein, partial [Planctomycetaceae bacterium]